MKKISVRRITLIGIMTALIAVLTATGFGMINLGFLPFKITILHLPVIVVSIIEGPIIGAVMGLFFGLSSLINNIAVPNWTSFVFYNPLVSVLPRIIVGITPYYTYMALKKLKARSVRIAFASLCGVLTNTILVMSSIYIIYAQRYFERWLQQEKNIGVQTTAFAAIFGSIGVNVACEIILAIIVAVPVVIALQNIYKKPEDSA